MHNVGLPVYPLPEGARNMLGNTVAVHIVDPEKVAVLIDSQAQVLGIGADSIVPMINQCPEHGEEFGIVGGEQFLLAPNYVQPIDVGEFLSELDPETIDRVAEVVTVAAQEYVDSLVSDFDPDDYEF